MLCHRMGEDMDDHAAYMPSSLGVYLSDHIKPMLNYKLC